jgi:histidinol-phosphate aminotransferase
MTPYGAPQVPATARMNTNENPYPPSEELGDAISKKVKEISHQLNRYPDRDAIALRRGLAEYLNEQSSVNLAVDNIWAANGSNEIIQTLFLTFGEGNALGFVPSYSMHALISKVTRTNWINGKRNADFSLDIKAACEEIVKTEARLVFITSPNNPTGSAVSLSEIEQMAKATQSVGGLLLVDEAYAEFSQQKSAVALLENFPNIVVIRTMSKAFAFAGARVGYMAANEEVIRAVQLVRLPYHLSQVTQAISLVALDHKNELLKNVSKLVEDRVKMSIALENLECKVLPSEANFLLFTVPSSKEIWDSMLEQGVLIRDVGLSGYLRVTIGTEKENREFIAALRVALRGRS